MRDPVNLAATKVFASTRSIKTVVQGSSSGKF
jgi:hypothetical protein